MTKINSNNKINPRKRIKPGRLAGTLLVCAMTFGSISGVSAQEGPNAHMQQTYGVIELPAPDSAVTCAKGAALLKTKGYSKIEAFDCAGSIFRFRLYKGTRRLIVLMNADSAGYVEVY